MSSISRRVYDELLAAKEEIATLQAENLNLQRDKDRLQRQTKLAYLEGIDQGRAQAVQVAS